MKLTEKFSAFFELMLVSHGKHWQHRFNCRRTQLLNGFVAFAERESFVDSPSMLIERLSVFH